MLTRKFDPLAILNIIGVYGFIVDGATGAIMKFEKVYYDVELELIEKDVAIAKKQEGSVLKESVTDGDADQEEVIKNDNDDPIFFIVEEMPQFPGGDDALRAFIGTNLQYPQEAQKNGIQGRVYVKFVVGTNGDVEDVKIARSVHKSLDKEALRVVSMLPKWKPGIQKGKPVRVSYTVPINFELTRSGAKKK